MAVLALVTAAATAAFLGLDLGRAAAHICPVPDQIPIAQLSTIDVGVTVEGATVVDVSITIPAGLQLERVDTKAGWTFVRDRSSVRYHGGPIAPYSCEYFSLGVTAPARGSFGIAVVQRTAAGSVVSRSKPNPDNATDRLLGQIIYAGVRPPPVATGSGGPSATTIAGIALLAFGLVMIGLLGFRAWRGRGLDDDRKVGQVDDERLAGRRFTKRTPDPPALP
jgi:hypothetical protein